MTHVSDSRALPQETKCYNPDRNEKDSAAQQTSLMNEPNHIAKCPPIDIEFVDLTYTVPVSKNG